jgi:hypothetical protein
MTTPDGILWLLDDNNVVLLDDCLDSRLRAIVTERQEVMFWTLGYRCPYCGSGRFWRSRQITFLERLCGILALPYRCKQCDRRFFRARWLGPAIEGHEPEPLWTSPWFGVPLSVAILAVSLVIIIGRGPKPEEPSADRSATVDGPAPEPRITTPALPGRGSQGGGGDARRADTPAFQAPADSRAKPAAEPPAPRLRGDHSLVVLAVDQAAALRLGRGTQSLIELIRQGSVFSVPAGTAVSVLWLENGLIRVRILDGPMAGREGWAQPRQMVPK